MNMLKETDRGAAPEDPDIFAAMEEGWKETTPIPVRVSA